MTHADKLRWVGDQLDADASNKGIGQGSEAARYCWAAATEIERIEDELEHTKADYLNACETIANMHCAAVGEVTGPKRGVVDDIEDLRLERDAILASKQMDFAQLVAQEDEIKLLKAENKRLREALNGGWVSFDVAQPEGLNLVQQYLGDHVLGQQNAQFWAFPTSMWRGTKHPHATHWRYVHGPMDRIEQLSLT